MSIDDSTKIVFTPSPNGTAEGSLPDVTQGAAGRIVVEVVGLDNNPIAISGTVTGHRWKESDPDTFYSISGSLSLPNEEGSTVLYWDIDATDTAEFSTIQDPWRVVFRHDGLVSIPVDWIVEENPAVDTSLATATTAPPESLSGGTNLRAKRFIVPIGSTSFTMDHNFDSSSVDIWRFRRTSDHGQVRAMTFPNSLDPKNSMIVSFSRPLIDECEIILIDIGESD